MKKKEKFTCNQCLKNMEGKLRFECGEGYIWFRACTNPKCPNYKLLQIPLERKFENERD